MDGQCKPVEPANPLAELIGSTLERIHYVPIYSVGYISITLCFSNGKSVTLQCKPVPLSQPDPAILVTKGDWEMLEAEPEERTDFMQRMPEVKPSREDVKKEVGTADLHEIDGANQD